MQGQTDLIESSFSVARGILREEIAKLRHDLEIYCAQDTMVLVKILKKLYEAIKIRSRKLISILLNLCKEIRIVFLPFLETFCHGKRAYYIHSYSVRSPFSGCHSGHSADTFLGGSIRTLAKVTEKTGT